jgi:hypothetical protein
LETTAAEADSKRGGKRGAIDVLTFGDRAVASGLVTAGAHRPDDAGPRPGGGALEDAGTNSSFPTGCLVEAAGKKSPKTGTGVTRRRGRGPRQGLILGMRAILSPTGEEDAALVCAPLTLKRNEGDKDRARSDDLQAEDLTSGDVDLGQALDALVG